MVMADLGVVSGVQSVTPIFARALPDLFLIAQIEMGE